MKSLLSIACLVLIYTIFVLSSCATQQEAKAPPAKSAPVAEAKAAPSSEKASPPAKAEAKEKAEKAPAPAKAEEAKAEKAEKAKAEKSKGDVGLLDTEKNYMILVTKEGKLVTLDFDQKTKVTMLEEKPVKMSEVGLGSAADVEYVTQGEKKIVTKMEFRPAKGE
ncbi:MAG: hypothetical protein E6J89_11175 [Deltaproteobacteria bacterium]|nr:MAG: hypothetical protein E6J89_11175 [Deltaproteobacteria bacterium]